MTHEDILWQDPPRIAAGHDGIETDNFVAILKTHPGQWAKFPHRMSVAFPSGLRRRHPQVEATSRENRIDADGKRRCDIYLRWPSDSAS